MGNLILGTPYRKRKIVTETSGYFDKGGLLVGNISSIRSLLKKAVESEYDRTTVEQGNYRINMVYDRGHLHLDFYYLDYYNPKFNPSVEHYASYYYDKHKKYISEFIHHNHRVYNQKGEKADLKIIIDKTAKALKELGYTWKISTDASILEKSKFAGGGFSDQNIINDLVRVYNKTGLKINDKINLDIDKLNKNNIKAELEKIPTKELSILWNDNYFYFKGGGSTDDEDTFSNILLAHGFKKIRSFAGVKHFYNKEKDTYGLVDYTIKKVFVYKYDYLVVEGRDYDGFSITSLLEYLKEKGYNRYDDGGTLEAREYDWDNAKERYEKFVLELEKLSKKYGVILQVVGGVDIKDKSEKIKDIEYDKDATSGDLIPRKAVIEDLISKKEVDIYE